MLMLAETKSIPPDRPALKSDFLEAIQSMPATRALVEHKPPLLHTLNPQSRAPGATPTTPRSLSKAPTVPATCVP